MNVSPRLRIALWILVAVFTGTVVHSQNSKATLSGLVRDTSGAVLQGARITLEPAAQPSSTNAQGSFFLAGLDPGKYKVTVTFVGFKPETREVDLAVGQN